MHIRDEPNKGKHQNDYGYGFVAYGVFGSVAERVSQNVKKFLNFK